MVNFPVEVFSWLRGFKSRTGSGVSHEHAPGAGGSKKYMELVCRASPCKQSMVCKMIMHPSYTW